MAPKSRRKKKYAGQRNPSVAPVGVAGPTRVASRPPSPGGTPPRANPVGVRAPTKMPSSPSVANLGREVRTIAVLAGALLVTLVILSFVLS